MRAPGINHIINSFIIIHSSYISGDVSCYIEHGTLLTYYPVSTMMALTEAVMALTSLRSTCPCRSARPGLPPVAFAVLSRSCVLSQPLCGRADSKWVARKDLVFSDFSASVERTSTASRPLSLGGRFAWPWCRWTRGTRRAMAASQTSLGRPRGRRRGSRVFILNFGRFFLTLSKKHKSQEDDFERSVVGGRRLKKK